jgi:hypothetical protein
MRLFFIFYLALIVMGCKESMDIDQISGPLADPSTLKLPKACELIEPAKLQEILNINYQVNLKDSSDPQNPNGQACFFRWDDPNTSNAAILIQVSTNPVYEEHPGYISGYVENKLKEGENIMGQDAPITYKSFKVGNKEGAYSFQQGRFYWSGGGNYLFMLAFNVSTLSESQMVSAAKKIIEEVHKNFAASI